MRLEYLPTNRAWAFVGEGGVLIPVDDNYLFSSRGEAVRAAERVGLEVDRHGNVWTNERDES